MFLLIGGFYVRLPVVLFGVVNHNPYNSIGVAFKDVGMNYFLLKLLFFLFDTTARFLDRLSLVFLFL